MEENCVGREVEDGFCHLDGGCHCCGKQSGMEETNQWPYSPRGELGTKSVSHVETVLNIFAGIRLAPGVLCLPWESLATVMSRVAFVFSNPCHSLDTLPPC